jgi:hypothetical protein
VIQLGVDEVAAALEVILADVEAAFRAEQPLELEAHSSMSGCGAP